MTRSVRRRATRAVPARRCAQPHRFQADSIGTGLPGSCGPHPALSSSDHGSASDQQVASHADPQVTDEFDRHPVSVPAQRIYGTDDPMSELNAERARRAIVEHTRRLAESAAAAGPDAAVPTTPGWTITDLVEHVSQTQHWVAEIIERRITDPAQLPTEMAVLPTDPGEWQGGVWVAPRGGAVGGV